MNIIARKPANGGDPEFERIVVDRGEGVSMRYVSATADKRSLEHNEWFWGHYFDTKTDAMNHFNGRS